MKTTTKSATKKPKKLLLALQAYEGDVADVAQVARLLTDIQDGETHPSADLLLVYRRDCKPRPELTLYCQQAFDQVHVHVTRPREVGYPAGPNGVWCDTMQHCLSMHKTGKWDYEAIFTTEGDTIPLATDWAEKLLFEWRDSEVPVLGRWMPSGEHDCGHINGNALFHPRLSEMIPIESCSARKAWDTNFAKMFHRLGWCQTELIHNWYQKKSATSWEIQKVADSGAVWLHGIKDGSARKWARKALLAK